ncbi:MAG: MotA/TolQ/ExbB proton channel family protein [Pirellulaceae bacterium]
MRLLLDPGTRVRFGSRARLLVVLTMLGLVLFAPGPITSYLAAQDETNVEEVVAPPDQEPEEETSGSLIERQLTDTESLTLISLVLRGGRIMIVLGVVSLLVVTLSFERLLAIRRSRVIPGNLVDELERLRIGNRGLEPREVYRLCKKYPSVLATAVKAMIFRVGRPQAEVQHAVSETCEREADRLYTNVRWISLFGAVAPLIGLMGTVWGIIWTFYQTTQLEIGADRADQLAGGIFVALVTTLGGLAIAIPAMIIAQHFESKIIKLFHELDEVLFNLLPGIEKYEGKIRVSHRSLGEPGPGDEPPATKTKSSTKVEPTPAPTGGTT